MLSMHLLIGLIAIALAFDFLNGLHDAANSIATVVSTRVLSPVVAVFWAAFFNFIAFLVFGLHVANTMGKGIIDANLGFNPIVDGKTIRVPLPDMSRERRQEFVKTAHRIAEEGRVHVRNVRRDAIETVKKAKLPEDEAKRLEKDIQTATDSAIKSINDHLAHKEKDLLTV